VQLRLLSWNLMHGRSLPGAGRDLLDEFTSALDAWQWDLALLQEVPPWWPALLAARLAARAAVVRTSRNAFPALRRAVAVRRPDLIKSGGGGANAILARVPEFRPEPHSPRAPDLSITAHASRRLRLLPERRMLHAVRLAQGCWVGNLHATAHNEQAARREATVAARAMQGWAAGEPVVLGGDFNVRGLTLAGLELIGASEVDYVFAAGLGAGGECTVLQHGRLSDHAPISVTLELAELEQEADKTDHARPAQRRGSARAPRSPPERS
jgi:endonuclease/exonuclease/phosphatase family metal-dependent hydrolase